MNWLKALSGATTVEGLLAIVNDYLLQQPEEFWAWIPRGSRPTLLASVDELHRWHRKLSDDLVAVADPNIRMQDLGVFFLRAAARALELESGLAPPSNDPSSESQQAG